MKKNSLKYDIQVIAFLLKQAKSISKLYLWMFSGNIISKAISPVLWVIMPKFILDELMGQRRMPTLLFLLGLFLALVFLIEGAGHLMTGWLYKNDVAVFLKMQRMLTGKAMEMDYPYLEDPKILDLKEKAIDGLRYSGGVQMMSRAVQKLLSSAISVIALLSVILTLHWGLTLSLILVVLLITLTNNRLRVIVYKFWDLLTEFNRKFKYLNNLMFDFRYGKDMRLSGMKEMLLNKNEAFRSQCHAYYIKQGKRERKLLQLLNCIGFVQALLVYGFSTVMTFLRKIPVSSFVMYISAASSMVTSCADMTESLIDLKRVSQYSASFYEFCRLPSKMPQKKQPLPPGLTLQLEHVSFSYPGTQAPVLEDVSLTIKQGQRLSIVGVNGAGKTTLVKLLLRLYDPDKGRILLDGVDIRELDLAEYRKKFSVVFQNYQIFAGTAVENIAGSGDYDPEKLEEAIEKANLGGVIASLPQREHTQLFKIFDPAGVELSGGQSGRLALARAIYKDAPLVILDEPTAALDPLAEYALYHDFHRLVQGKTTVYISHRLSSCRFCDVIAVFQDGRLAEYGSHKELLSTSDGLYASMWSAQSKYYVK